MKFSIFSRRKSKKTSKKSALGKAKPVVEYHPQSTLDTAKDSLEDSISVISDTSPTTSNHSETFLGVENASQWTTKSVNQVAQCWKLDQKGVTKLWQLHQRLSDIQHWKNQPNEVVRYLIDAHGHISKADAKFRRMIHWRIDQEIDSIIHDYTSPHPLLADYLPVTVLDGTDKDGDPIWLERVGVMDSAGLLKVFGKDALLRYAIHIREVCLRGEWAREYERRHGKPPSRATAIMDLSGLGWDHCCNPGVLPFLKVGLSIIQNYNVGFGKKVIILHTSKWFHLIWKIVSPLCEQNLKNKLVFATSENYLEVLEQYVDLETLPPCIYKGGKGKGGVAMPQKLEGGKVPKWDELNRLWEERQQYKKDERVPDMIRASSCTVSDDFDEYYLERRSMDSIEMEALLMKESLKPSLKKQVSFAVGVKGHSLCSGVF